MTRKALRWLMHRLIDLIADVEIRGVENFPASGSYIVAVNHIGFIDILMFHYQFDRFDMFIPVAEKWEKHGWIRWVARALNFVFIDRYNPDLKAMRKMIHLMNEGNSLVIAPEGTRSHTASMNQGKPGVAFLAAKSGFPVIPVGMIGTEDRNILGNIKHFKRSKIRLTIGRSFSIAPLPTEGKEETLKAATDEVMCHIAALLPESYRGVYANHPRTAELLNLR